ncbi:MAG: cytochrome c peroxidase, partial [Planctomycetota bacterium]
MPTPPLGRLGLAALCVILVVPLAGCGSGSGSSESAPLVAFSTSDPLSATIDLGRELIFDPRLSRPRGVSCGMCHDPFLGWGDGRPQGKGIQDNTLAGDLDGDGTVDHEPTLAVAGNRFKTRLTPRNTPTIYNSHLFPNLFWDGRSGDLVHQAQFPVEAGVEMNSSWDEHVLPLLQSDPDYIAAFQEIWGEAPSRARAIEAMGAYEATISVFDTPYDAFLAGDEGALSADQRAGHDLFFGKAGCGDCHSAPLLTDFSFANTGVPSAGIHVLEGTVDLGRGQFTDLTQDPAVDVDNPADYAKFKTPQL